MPRTRRHIDRDTKRTQLLDAAERRVLEGGYGALSLSALARELELAQNSIYWYFASKDALFVAVLERLLERIVIPARRRQTNAVAWVLRALDQLAELQSVRASAHERAAKSEVVAAFEARFRDLVYDLLKKAFADRLPPGQLDLAVRTFVATADGTFSQGLEATERRRITRFALQKLLDSAP